MVAHHRQNLEATYLTRLGCLWGLGVETEHLPLARTLEAMGPARLGLALGGGHLETGRALGGAVADLVNRRLVEWVVSVVEDPLPHLVQGLVALVAPQ
jgi:hypothetical protein